jgi:hypothetical protein
MATVPARLAFCVRAALPVVALCMGVASPACADRWFGSIAVSCDSFAECGLWPDMPEPPADPALLFLLRTGSANAPLQMIVRVNKPVEGGVPIRLTLGEATFELQPGTDVLTRRESFNGVEHLTGYSIAPSRVDALLATMRQAKDGRLRLAVAGAPQEREIRLDGMDEALRYVDERQGRNGAQDALIDKGAREPANAAAPKALPLPRAWPKQIVRILKREQCEDRLASFEELTAGFIATPAPGRELWQIACAGGNYNILFILIDVRNGDATTARVLTFPTRLHKRPSSVLVNPVWWDARKEVWAFHRSRSVGDCGTVARYRWTARGFALADERRKEDCDSKFDDPWTRWPATKAKLRR